MELPDLGPFESGQPEVFYMGQGAEELHATADALLVVEGQRLRVHSQVLSVQSRVLRSPFAARAEGGGDSGGERGVSTCRLLRLDVGRAPVTPCLHLTG